jgi:hypothetical protein
MKWSGFLTPYVASQNRLLKALTWEIARAQKLSKPIKDCSRHDILGARPYSVGNFSVQKQSSE